MEYNEFVVKNGIATRRVLIDEPHAKEYGVPIEYDDRLVAYYLEDGYSYIGLPIPRKDSKVGLTKSIVWRLCFTVVVLNPEKSVDLLVDFMDLYLKTFYLSDGTTSDRNALRDMIDYSFEKGSEGKVMTTKKYFWVEALTLKEKQLVVMSNMNDRKVTETIKIIDNAIDAIAEEGVRFITIVEIKKMVDEIYGSDYMSERNIRNYTEEFRGKIDDYNHHVFGTDSFHKYRKMLSIHKIVDAIKVLDSEGDRLSRRKVADEAGVHFNTVQKLWGSKEVQEELNNYNSVYG